MPRYFFDVHDGQSVHDAEGTELPDLAAARSMALRYSGELIASGGGLFSNDHDWRMEVADENRMILFTLTLITSDSACLGQPRVGDH